ncbi:hypothetical protein [Pleionea sp. CnH1-48]|uniref:hypothetical protein n=1 Tax=Pleionea sp. CnH1-48 TaxID=2954494 RepID=UPI002097213A|nr:hypothetical protein [Pleionea sp. CnH1-48]MCO7223210.1 hypothetical protein [Pleionea sp. CnH1-48]
MISTIIKYQEKPIQIHRFNNELWFNLKHIGFLSNIEKPVEKLVDLVGEVDAVVAHTNRGGTHTEFVIPVSEVLKLIQQSEYINEAHFEVWLEEVEKLFTDLTIGCYFMDFEKTDEFHVLMKEAEESYELEKGLSSMMH